MSLEDQSGYKSVEERQAAEKSKGPNQIEKDGTIINEEVFDNLCHEEAKRLIDENSHLRNLSQEELNGIKVPKNITRVRVFLEAEKNGLAIAENIKNDNRLLVEEYHALIKDAEIKENNMMPYKESSNDQNRTMLLEVIRPIKAGAKIVFEAIKGNNPEDEGDKVDANKAAETTMIAVARQDIEAMHNTSFLAGHEDFLIAILSKLLTSDQIAQLSTVSSRQEAIDFIESQPFAGKKIAEIGGSATSILRYLGASVDNASTITRNVPDSQRKLAHKVSLDTWQMFYEANIYDLVCSHMVMDRGSGIEDIRPEYERDVDTTAAALELHKVSNKMMKMGAVSLHVGHQSYDSHWKELVRGEQHKRIVDLIADGQESRLNTRVKSGTYVHWYLREFLPKIASEADYSHSFENYMTHCGLQPIGYIDEYQCHELSLSDNLAVYRKIGDLE